MKIPLLAPFGVRTPRRTALRRLVRSAALLGAAGTGLFGLVACQRGQEGASPAGAKDAAPVSTKPAASFRGIDLSGSNFGRDFQLADPQGRMRTLADFRGKVVMIFFGYTQCPDVCPTALMRAKSVREQLGPRGADLQVLFVTVDPERDTPELLAAYTAAFDAGVIGLRGDAEATARTAREFKVLYMKVPTGSSYTVDHTALSYLYDPQGRLRVALSHNQTVEDFTHDVRSLLDGA